MALSQCDIDREWLEQLNSISNPGTDVESTPTSPLPRYESFELLSTNFSPREEVNYEDGPLTSAENSPGKATKKELEEDYWRGLTGDSPSKNDRMLFYESIYDVHSKNKYRLSYVYRGRGRPRKNSTPTIARELHYNKDISDILDMSKTFPVLSPTRLPEREIAIHDEVRSVQDRDQVCCSSCDSEGMHSLKETSKALIAPATLSKLCGLQADVSDGDAEMFLTSLLDIFPEEFNRNEQIIHLGYHCHGNFLQFPPNTGTTKDAEYKRRSAISEVKYCAGHDLSTQSIPLPMHAQSISNSKPEARQSDGRRRKAGEHARKVLMSWVLEHQDNPYPTQAEKDSLSQGSGLSVKQVTHWMSNMRKRRLIPLLSGRKIPKTRIDYKLIDGLRRNGQTSMEEERFN